jgi:hypothetical protein
MNFIRSTVVLMGAGGGVWAAHRAVEVMARHAGGASQSHLSPEAMPIMIPIGLFGALLGAFLGGLILPVRR